MFDNIKSLRPYFFSLREIDNNVSLDLKLPLNWEYEKITTPYRSIKIKIQDKNDRFNLLSLVSVATQEGYDVILSCAKEIIKINKEEEEKKRLFEEKVNELKLLFKNQPLDKLKDISLIEEYEERDSKRNGMVEERDEEGRIRGISAQTEND